MGDLGLLLAGLGSKCCLTMVVSGSCFVLVLLDACDGLGQSQQQLPVCPAAWAWLLPRVWTWICISKLQVLDSGLPVNVWQLNPGLSDPRASSVPLQELGHLSRPGSDSDGGFMLLRSLDLEDLI